MKPNNKKLVIYTYWNDFMTSEMQEELLTKYGITTTYERSGYEFYTFDLKSKQSTMGFIFFCHLVNIILVDSILEIMIKDYSHFFGDVELITKKEIRAMREKALSLCQELLKVREEQKQKHDKFRDCFLEYTPKITVPNLTQWN